MSKIEQLQEFLNESPNDSFLRYALALELVKLREYTEANKIFQSLVENDPQYLATYLQYGNILAELGQSDQATEIYQQGIHIASSQSKSKTQQELEQALFLLD